MNDCCKTKNRSRGQLGILCCTSGEPFGKRIHASLKSRFEEEKCTSELPLLVETKETHFPNTEVKVEIMESIRGLDMYIVQDAENKEYDKSTFMEHLPLKYLNLPFPLPEDIDQNMLVEVRRPYSVDENMRAMFTAIDAAKRADASYVSVVLPVFPYARQDKAISRECITASRMAQAIENYSVNKVLTLDLHNTAIAGFFRDTICENLHSSKIIMEYVKQNLQMDNLVVVSPDEGGIARANYYAKRLGSKLAMGHKRRDYSKASHVEELRILGPVVRRHNTLEEQVKTIDEVISAEGVNPIDALRRISEIIKQKAEGLDVLFVDDMIATGGSLEKGVKKVHELGAKSVWFACALPLFTYPATQKIDDLYIKGLLKGVIGTNAVYHSTEEFKKAHPWYHEVHVEKYFADAMFNVNHFRSISELLL